MRHLRRTRRTHGRRRRAGFAALVVLANVAFVVFILSWPDPEPVEPFVPSASLQIATVPDVDAGEPFEVWVAGAGDADVTLSLDAGYGPRHAYATSVDDLAHFEIPAADRPESGTVLLTAHSGSLVGDGTVEIHPGESFDPLDLYLGPRTVLADTEHFVMLVAVPKDRFGNPVPQGTQVNYETTRPNMVKEFESSPTRLLLSHYIVYSRTVAGRTRIATTSDDAGGPERTFLEVAGVPAEYELLVPDELPAADGQALIPVITEELFDRYDNQLPDGTAVVLDATGVTGVRRLNGFTIDGRAEFQLEVPDRGGTVLLVATASGASSRPLEVDFLPAVTDIAARTEPDEQGTRVVIGPIRTVRDAYAPDGTEVIVEYGDESLAGVLFEGIGSVVISEPFDSYVVRILGAEASFEVEP